MKDISKVMAPAAAILLGSAAFLTGCQSAPVNNPVADYEKPLIVAHRGGKGEYDDNAVGGFVKCYENGIRGFEVDIKFSADDKLVVMHDDTVDRTTNGKGNVNDMTAKEITSLKLKKSNENVPTCQEFMNAFKGKKDVFIELEMKVYPGKLYTKERLERYCDALYRMAKNTLEPNTYVFTCFGYGTIETMMRLHPDARCALIKGGALDQKHIDNALKLGCVQVSPGLKGTTAEMVKKAHNNGLKVALWMVQDAKAYEEAKTKGADTITSDYPMRLKKEVVK